MFKPRGSNRENLIYGSIFFVIIVIITVILSII